jgi:HAD superfamily hydrolase (TIGR01509 family)
VSSPRAVVFDNDGLLLDSEVLWTRAEEKLFEARGLEFTPAHKLQLVGTSEQVAGPLLAGMLDEPGRAVEIMVELHKLVMIEAQGGGEPMAGARELVEALVARGTPMALVSNSPKEFVEKVLGPTGLTNAFRFLLTPRHGYAPKPSPMLYVEACRRLDAAPADSVALEDSVPGVEAANAAGMTVIGVPSVPGVVLDAADLVAPSLTAPEVWVTLGLRP